MPIQGEAFEMPTNDGLFVIYQNSCHIEHEEVKPSNEELTDSTTKYVSYSNWYEDVYVDDALWSQLELFLYYYEILSKLPKRIISNPKYI